MHCHPQHLGVPDKDDRFPRLPLAAAHIKNTGKMCGTTCFICIISYHSVLTVHWKWWFPVSSSACVHNLTFMRQSRMVWAHYSLFVFVFFPVKNYMIELCWSLDSLFCIIIKSKVLQTLWALQPRRLAGRVTGGWQTLIFFQFSFFFSSTFYELFFREFDLFLS